MKLYAEDLTNRLETICIIRTIQFSIPNLKNEVSPLQGTAL